MKYIICQMGGAVVGLVGSDEEAEADKNLAHNLFNATTRDDVFNGRISFASDHQFMKFLIYKEKFKNGGCLRSAAKVAREILTEKTSREDFMSHIRNQLRGYYSVTSLTQNNETED